MAKGQHKPGPVPAGNASVEEKIKAACDEAGISAEDVGGGPAAGVTTQKFGDGAFLTKLIKFLTLLGPILGPILAAGEEGSKHPDE